MVASHQIRAGRVMIGMGQKELADAAGIAVATLRRMESDDVGPERSSFAAVEKVCGILRAAGIIFIAANGEGAGVRLRKDRDSPASQT
jgi:predicted transcriptional regulator